MRLLKHFGLSAIAMGLAAGCASNSAYGRNGELNEGFSERFEQHGLDHAYDSSCDAVERSRDRNIRHPFSWSTPDYFEYDQDSLALFSPHLTATERRTAERVIDDIPPYVLDVFYKSGGVFIFTSNSLVEAVPGFATSKKPDGSYRYYESSVGMHMDHERRAFMTFRIARDVVIGEDGRPEPTGFRNVSGSKDRILSHEIGHFMDYYLGRQMRPARYGPPGNFTLRSHFSRTTNRFSESDLFRRAVALDFQDINAPDNTVSDSWLRSRGYFFPKRYDGHDMHGENTFMSIARREMFAELWAEAQGVGTQNMKRYMPHAYALVAQIHDDMKEAYEQSGRTCELEDLVRLRAGDPASSPS